MNTKLIAYAVALALAFGAGWATNGWRKDREVSAQRIDTLRQAIVDRDAAIKATNTKLGEVVSKVDAAAESANLISNQISGMNQLNSRNIEAISNRTQDIKNEIASIGVPKCTYSVEFGGMYKRVGEAANSGRNSLYPASN